MFLSKVDSQEVISDIIEALEKARKEKGYTIDQVAILAGSNRNTYHRFINGKGTPYSHTLANFCLAHDLDLTIKPLRNENATKIHSEAR